jgi:hypothetical protein
LRRKSSLSHASDLLLRMQKVKVEETGACGTGLGARDLYQKVRTELFIIVPRFVPRETLGDVNMPVSSRIEKADGLWSSRVRSLRSGNRGLGLRTIGHPRGAAQLLSSLSRDPKLPRRSRNSPQIVKPDPFWQPLTFGTCAQCRQFWTLSQP